MESVGQSLLHERLRSQLTLEEISASTRISVKNLQAIENDDVSQFSSSFYYKTFVRQFAESLNLDFSALSESVAGLASVIPAPLVPGEDQFLPKVAPLRTTVKMSFRWLYSLMALIIVLTACTGLYGVWQKSKYNLRSSSQTITARAPAAHLVLSGFNRSGE